MPADTTRPGAPPPPAADNPQIGDKIGSAIVTPVPPPEQQRGGGPALAITMPPMDAPWKKDETRPFWVMQAFLRWHEGMVAHFDEETSRRLVKSGHLLPYTEGETEPPAPKAESFNENRPNDAANRGQVNIPDDWDKGSPPTKIALAKRLTGRTDITSKLEAETEIKAELQRREKVRADSNPRA